MVQCVHASIKPHISFISLQTANGVVVGISSSSSSSSTSGSIKKAVACSVRLAGGIGWFLFILFNIYFASIDSSFLSIKFSNIFHFFSLSLSFSCPPSFSFPLMLNFVVVGFVHCCCANRSMHSLVLFIPVF